jgi:acetyltransferase-like isoleucine patch superfamily enzyme
LSGQTRREDRVQAFRLFNRDNGQEVRLWTAIYRRLLGRLGKGSILSRADQMLNPQHIFIGAQVGIAHGARLDAIRQFGGTAYGGEIHIGDRTSIQPFAHIAAAATLRIGCSVLTGSRIFVTDHDHQFADLDTPIAYQPLVVEPVSVEDFVWLGENVVVLKGVTVGHHAVIGANSVVTTDIPPYAIAAGAPAKVVKFRNVR